MQYDMSNFTRPRMVGLGSADDLIYRNDAIYMPIVLNDLRVQILDLRQMKHRNDWISHPHRHPWYEFNFVSGGSVFTTINGVEFLPQKGSFFLVPPQAAHSHRHHDFQGDSGFCLRFLLEKIELAETAYPVADRLIAALEACEPKAYYFPADQLLRDIERGSELQFPAMFLSWLMQICGVISPDDRQASMGGHEAQKASLVRQIDLYLESFFAEPFTPDEIARSLNYSYRHLSRVYRQATGTTITQQLNRIRIRKAKELLADPALSVKTVSEQAGFRSYAGFFKVFENTVGCTPSEFRHRSTL